MGCQTSSEVQVPKDRRRLSVGIGEVDTKGGVENHETSDDRGMVSFLEGKDILKFAGDAGANGRKASISSITDKGETSFSEKSAQALGDKIDPANSGLGYTCRKGLKPESPNQDSFSILQVDGSFSIYGVYDGHGKQGHDVSNFVKESLPKLILRDKRFNTADMLPMMKEQFIKMQSMITSMDKMERLSAQLSGTTVTVAVHDYVTNKLFVAHVADSTCVIGEYTDNSRTVLQARALTRDHKPNLADERARIEKAGGRVVFDGFANYRVYAKNGRYPGLNMSRCLGDLLGHQEAGCSCVPEVSEVQLGPLSHILLLCSDGVWEFISPEEAMKMVAEYPPDQAMQAAERLAKEAWDRWLHEEDGAVVDDITVVLVHLQP